MGYDDAKLIRALGYDALSRTVESYFDHLAGLVVAVVYARTQVMSDPLTIDHIRRVSDKLSREVDVMRRLGNCQ